MCVNSYYVPTLSRLRIQWKEKNTQFTFSGSVHKNNYANEYIVIK